MSTQKSRSLKVPQRKLIIYPLFTLLASSLLPDYDSVCALALILMLEHSYIGLIYSSVNQKDVGRITDLIAQ